MRTYNTADRPGFVRQQYAFAANIRNPEKNPRLADVEERRMKIYQELFYNNVEDFIANTYPILRRILTDDRWHAMIRDYFANHLSHTPLFPEMPREFLKYLEQERAPDPADPAFMLELAHYEWVELALSMLNEEIDAEKIDGQGDLLAGVPVVSPLAWILSYHYPVHRISPEFQPQKADGKLTHLIVFRDDADEVRFIETNQVTARLLQLMIDNRSRTGGELLEQIVVELNHTQPEVVRNGGIQILQNLKARNVVLGVFSND